MRAALVERLARPCVIPVHLLEDGALRWIASAAAMLAVLVPTCGAADEEIVVDLLPPVTEAAPSRSSGGHTQRRTTSLSSRAGARRSTGERVIGRLGVAKVVAEIRRTRSFSGRLLARARAGQYLALTADAGEWFGVLMDDGSTGWLRKASVSVLDYEVVAPSQPAGSGLPPGAPDPGSAVLNGGQRSLLQVAYSFLGVPYRYGGNTARGIDCSSFVQQCFRVLGIGLPRTAAEQAQCGLAVPVEYLQPADRLYFRNRDGRISHTGIYIGNGLFIHASSSLKGVGISRITEPMYARMFAGARR